LTQEIAAMMDGGRVGGHWFFSAVFWVLVVLAIAALIKYLIKK
jgi:uncharacterized membrane protein